MAMDDLPLRDPGGTPPAPAPPRPSPSRWLVLGAGAIIAGALLALWWMSRAQPGAAPPAATTPTELAPSATRPTRQPLELPALADSDSMLRDLVGALSRRPLMARLLATKGLVRAATLAVVQIGDGKTPAGPFAVLRPSSRLQIQGTTSGKIDAASYARWNPAVDALQSVRPADLAQLYVNVKPLFDEAYRELGAPEGDFDGALVKAVRTLSATPAVQGDPVLLRRPNYFEHDDGVLRAALPVQKQLILMGPENRTKILAWLRDVALTLELKID
jgi:hypothetical protein